MWLHAFAVASIRTLGIKPPLGMAVSQTTPGVCPGLPLAQGRQEGPGSPCILVEPTPHTHTCSTGETETRRAPALSKAEGGGAGEGLCEKLPLPLIRAWHLSPASTAPWPAWRCQSGAGVSGGLSLNCSLTCWETGSLSGHS